uniref:Uncharacterized protein n=2 Tax=Avena sativa TaxID=4498 RepID=A0ACD6AJ87_AVESA
MGFANRPNNADVAHSRNSSVASSGTTPAASTSSSTRTSSLSSVDGGASDDGNGRAGRSPARAPGHTLEAPSRKNRSGRSSSRSARLFQKLRSALPVLAPRCGRMPAGSASEIAAAASTSSGAADSHLLSHVVSFSSGGGRPCLRVTGTLFGRRKGRVALALQESPRCLPSLVVELALQTHALLRELGNPAGARIVLETERRAAGGGEGAARPPRRPAPLLDEVAWTMFCNGRKTGYAVRREATDDDLTVMETLRAVSMGAGVLPPARGSSPDDEVAYMRGCFEHFVGSRDSESLYMVSPQGGGTGPELAVFFVRL